MDKAIERRFTDTRKAETAARFGVAASQLLPLASSESFIFEFPYQGEPNILRVSHSSRRSEAMIRGEVDWLNFLAEAGIGVAGALASPAGHLIESIPDAQGAQFLATAFSRASGRPPHETGWSEALDWKLGQLLGRIHARSRNYVPGPGCFRPQWQHEGLDLVEQYLPDSEDVALELYRLNEKARGKLPRNRASYGLIHQDAHGGNFFVDEAGELTLFDFDDCMYSWYINDVAMALFYRVIGHDRPEELARAFLPPFLDGYRSASPLDDAWLQHVPLFLKAREIELYALMFREWGSLEAVDHPWDLQFTAGRKQRIDNNRPFLNLDFTTYP